MDSEEHKSPQFMTIEEEGRELFSLNKAEQDMDFGDDRELTTDPDMKDIYFLQPDPPS